ncbi:MAG: hypothetical protein OEW75_19035, partial [Cyclobacteriaceae bacterium]|nr:hypothetical protein [Cyclobacteriaceae bacterium]
TIGIWALIMVFFILFATLSNEALHFEILPEIIYSSYSEYAKNSEPGTYIIYEKLDNTYLSILLSIPKALVAGWFRPWLGESQSLFQFLSTIENFALSILFIFSLKNIPELLKTKNMFVYSAIIFCVITSVLVALSVPNFGSLVRFRTGWLFIFALLILYNNPLLEKVGIFIKKHQHG